MNNPLAVMFIVFGVVMVGLTISEGKEKEARYQCIQEVAKTQSVDKAKELCK